jgi:proteasome accessory factor B
MLDRMIRAGDYPNARSAGMALEVHPRTIHRDLEFLRDSLQAPLAFWHRRNGYYYSDPYYAFPLLHLTEGDVVALFLAERALEQYRGTPYAADLAAAFAKLTAALPGEMVGEGVSGKAGKRCQDRMGTYLRAELTKTCVFGLAVS